jgi:hypothetical protein
VSRSCASQHNVHHAWQEQEARTNLLRAKARERTGETPAFESARPPPPAAGHINFFYDEERVCIIGAI